MILTLLLTFLDNCTEIEPLEVKHSEPVTCDKSKKPKRRSFKVAKDK